MHCHLASCKHFTFISCLYYYFLSLLSWCEPSPLLTLTFFALSLSDDTRSGSLLSSVYWGFLLIGRLAGVPLSRRFTAPQLVAGDLVLSIITLLILIIFNGVIPVLWVTSALLGLFVATVYAACITILENTVELSGIVMSMAVVFTSLGEAIFPFFIGMTFDFPAGPISMMYTCLGTICITSIMYGGGMIYRNKYTPKLGAIMQRPDGVGASDEDFDMARNEVQPAIITAREEVDVDGDNLNAKSRAVKNRKHIEDIELS